MACKSILQNDKRCYFCGAIKGLHLHHIYGGSNRAVSDQNGFVVYLCEKHHTGHLTGVHADIYLRNRLKKVCQKEFEKTHSREDFIELIGENFLGD